MPIQIDHVLTDRARVYHPTEGARVEFETEYHDTIGPWFPCRFALPEGEERFGQQHTDLSKRYIFIARLTDFSGVPHSISPEDKLEIEQGPGVYTPVGMFQIVDTVKKPRNLEEELLYYMHLEQIERL